MWAHFLRRQGEGSEGAAKNRAIRSNFCPAKIPLLSLARLKMASMPFLALGFCEAKTYESWEIVTPSLGFKNSP
jgi:hypothetical protein